MADYDSPWKEALAEYFEAFVKLFFSAIHAGIDWSRGYRTLDTELQQIAPDAEQGRRSVDKLVEVWRTDGQEEWILIHVEVQGQETKEFGLRMFVYNSRLVERYNKPVVSVAVLADENPRWTPQVYHRELWGCSTEFHFPVVKLLDYAARSDELEQSDNPFATFVLAYLKSLEFKRDDASRYAWKLRLVRGLFERGWDAKRVRKLFRLIDWVMFLPEALTAQFRHELIKVEEEKHMPYVTSIERLAQEEGWKKGSEEGWKKGSEEGWKKGREEGQEEGWKKGSEEGWKKGREEGREEGLREGIRSILDLRFGEDGAALLPEIEAIRDTRLLETVLKQAVRVASPEQLRDCWK